MNPLRRLGPYLYSAVRSYEMAWELLLLGGERRTAQRDAVRLRHRLPFLADYPKRAVAARARLLEAYADYTATVSPETIAISLSLATFLAVLCDELRPRSILDLGSGFSSYVFRAYAKRSGVAPAAPVVDSVDKSLPWLDQTRAFLARHQLDGERLSTLEELGATSRPPFDLVLQDIATLGTRLAMLDAVIAACRPGGAIVIDDMHVPAYRRAVIRELERRGLSHYSLRAFTKRKLRYSYLVLP